VKVRRRELLLVVLLTLLQAFGVRTGKAEPGPAVAGLVTVLAIVQGAAVLLWRDRPGRMLTLVTAAYIAAAILYPIMPPYVLLAALVLQARRRPFRPALFGGVGAIAAMAAGCVLAVTWRDGPAADTIALYVLLAAIALLGGLLAAARTAEREALRRRAMVEERLRIAHDLHDVVGHGLASIAVQSSTARMALAAGREEEALAALSAAETASRQALAETRELVAVLGRESDQDLSNLDRLVASVSGRSLRVDLQVHGDPRMVSVQASRAAYRVVQESLTNVVRHSGAKRADVQVDVSDERVRIIVCDEGSTAAAAEAAVPASGTGLTAMRQRVEALRGTVEAGPRPDSAGWRVTAVLPNALATRPRDADRGPRVVQ
jgi:signal transduction histidine kinase